MLLAATLSLPAIGTSAGIDTTATESAVTSETLPKTALPLYREGKSGKFPKRHAENLQRIKEGPIDLLFLGDSITDRWHEVPELWNASFRKWKPANFGVGGDRTENVLWRLENGELDGVSPRVVVLMIGTNNTHSNLPEDIVSGIRRIIEVIQQKAPETKILLLGIFPREPRIRNGVPVTMPMDKIKIINKELPKLAEEGKVRYLDIGNHFLSDGKVPKDVMPDGVHLNAKGYAIWAKAVTPVLKEMMK